MRRLLSALTSLTLYAFFLCSNVACALPISSNELSKMVQDCPSLEEYPGAQGVIWHRDASYVQESDGTMSRSLHLVILANPGMDASVIQPFLYAPAGGRIELEQAAVFDPIHSNWIADLHPTRKDWQSVGHMEFSFPKLTEPYLLVLSVRQYFQTQRQMNDLIWLGSSLPLWKEVSA